MSGSVNASVSATAGSSSSACRVGCKACVCVCLSVSELLRDNYYFKFVCVFKGCGVHSYNCVTH